MSEISAHDPRLLTPVPLILETLRNTFGVQTDEQVFIRAFEDNGVSEGREAYRIFRAGGSAFLPASVQCEFLKCVPHVHT